LNFGNAEVGAAHLRQIMQIEEAVDGFEVMAVLRRIVQDGDRAASDRKNSGCLDRRGASRNAVGFAGQVARRRLRTRFSRGSYIGTVAADRQANARLKPLSSMCRAWVVIFFV
jgi:hypothetical protein